VVEGLPVGFLVINRLHRKLLGTMTLLIGKKKLSGTTVPDSIER
jgi:hypothetical protein